MDSIDDLATLSQLDENTLLNELKRRYVEKKIYVSIGTEFLSSVRDCVSVTDIRVGLSTHSIFRKTSNTNA